MSTCACGRPVGDAVCCQGCADTLSVALGEVPAMVGEVEITLTRQAVIGTHAGPRASVPPLAFDLRASEALRQLHGVLSGWVRLIFEEQYGSDETKRPLPADRAGSLAGWLMREVEWLRHHPAGMEAIDEITGAVANAHRVIDLPPDRVFAGICSADHNGVECTEPLYARPRAVEVRCRVCGTTHEVAQRRAVLEAAVEDVLARASEICRAVGWVGHHVRKDQLSRWAASGRLVAKGHETVGERQHALYRIGDVLDLVATLVRDEPLRATSRGVR